MHSQQTINFILQELRYRMHRGGSPASRNTEVK
jgi:hypothetical protein